MYGQRYCIRRNQAHPLRGGKLRPGRHGTNRTGRSGGNVYASYVQDCTIKSLNKAGGMYGIQTGSWGWSNQIRVTNSTVVAENSMAGGISGDFGNAENAHAYMKEMQISNTQIKAKTAHTITKNMHFKT